MIDRKTKIEALRKYLESDLTMEEISKEYGSRGLLSLWIRDESIIDDFCRSVGLTASDVKMKLNGKGRKTIKTRTRIAEIEARLGEPIGEYVKREYESAHKSFRKIGKDIGIHSHAVRSLALSAGVTPRDRVEACIAFHDARRPKPSDDELKELYLKEDMSPPKMAKHYGVPLTTLRTWLDRAGVDTSYYKTKTRGMRKLERRLGEPIEVYLHREYEVNERSTDDIGESLGIKAAAIRKWISRVGIKFRENTYPTERVKEARIQAKNKNPLRNWDTYVQSVMEVIEKYGKLPNGKELANIGRHDIRHATEFHGGFTEVRKRLNMTNRKGRGYWTWENLQSELKTMIDGEFVDEHGDVIKYAGDFPTSKQVKAIGKTGMIYAIQKYGNLTTVRERMGYNRITDSQAFATLIETAEDARLVVEHFGGNDADVADILAVMYEGRLSRDDALQFLEDPSLRKYLGSFQRPSGISDIFDAGMHLLPYDKSGVIRDIIYRKALEYRADRLGPMPTTEQRQRLLQELEVEIGTL